MENNFKTVDSELKSKLSELLEIGIISETEDDRIKKLKQLKDMICTFVNERIVLEYEKVFKALGSKTRLAILQLILSGIRCSCEIEYILELSQSTVSHHLKILSESRIIRLEKSGKWVFAFSTVNKKFSKELFLDILNLIL
ncbi:MAG: metalloregulator ArsR/SmtB family transcription factor [Candidatus Heimdallarchaeum endolithica]|uniref:Metalloregulator ArsR/SmtB family transcription factor n=1 Tax=Candidatus Heimdallarchaeum endolithica TaxID=2876572 RepID=A0A9Y1BRL3_9ARCH|nr:MAG: metalloregulator ArsR/SmtB family transcription factor [Candidatus Heimdallarchaeum endolithica]